MTTNLVFADKPTAKAHIDILRGEEAPAVQHGMFQTDRNTLGLAGGAYFHQLGLGGGAYFHELGLGGLLPSTGPWGPTSINWA